MNWLYVMAGMILLFSIGALLFVKYDEHKHRAKEAK